MTSESDRESKRVCAWALPLDLARAWARCMIARFELVLDRGTSLSVSLFLSQCPPSLSLSLSIKFALHASVRSREAQASHGWRERTLSDLPLLSFSRQISLSTQRAHAQERTRTSTHGRTHTRARTQEHTHTQERTQGSRRKRSAGARA